MRTGATICSIAVLLLSVALDAESDAPVCHAHSGGPYCSYTGFVKHAYVNEANTVLIYFDTDLDLAAPTAVGMTGITSASACSHSLSTEFGKMLYASALSAQARAVKITMQMRQQNSSYLKCDRIWVHQQ